MKISDVFDISPELMVDGRGGLISRYCEINEEKCEAIEDAVLSHDKLVELLEYFYKQPVDLSQVWPAGHIAKQNEAAFLLKELGHEI